MSSTQFMSTVFCPPTLHYHEEPGSTFLPKKLNLSLTGVREDCSNKLASVFYIWSKNNHFSWTTGHFPRKLLATLSTWSTEVPMSFSQELLPSWSDPDVPSILPSTGRSLELSLLILVRLVHSCSLCLLHLCSSTTPEHVTIWWYLQTLWELTLSFPAHHR